MVHGMLLRIGSRNRVQDLEDCGARRRGVFVSVLSPSASFMTREKDVSRSANPKSEGSCSLGAL